MSINHDQLLEVKHLAVRFHMYQQKFTQHNLEAISDLSLTVRKGEILAVVGSSGSGKSLLAHAILGILPANAQVLGRMSYEGRPLTPDYQKELRGDKIAFVPQSISYLDPLMQVGKQVQGTHYSPERQEKIFRRYGLNEKVSRLFPFQLSGGMARRVLISTAVISAAELIIADEPTPGLNPEIAEETMKNFRELADQGCAVLLITHDLDLALAYADQVAVFYAGTTVEISPAQDFIQGEKFLRHPYSKALWRALPQNGFQAMDGFQPYSGQQPTGCLFANRCPDRSNECSGTIPLKQIRGGEVRCVHAS